SVYEGRPTPEPGKVAGPRNVQQTAHYVSADFSGGMVDFHDRGESGQAQYLRLPGTRHQQLSSISFVGSNQGTEAAYQDWQVFDSFRQDGDQGDAEGHAVLALAGQGGNFQFRDSRSGHISAGEISGRAAFRDVRSRPEGQP